MDLTEPLVKTLDKDSKKNKVSFKQEVKLFLSEVLETLRAISGTKTALMEYNDLV